MGTPPGQDIIDGLQEFADALEHEESISEKFTSHTIVLDIEPTDYDPELVKKTRKILNVSQSVFARFLGVSVKTVRAWEGGDNRVNGAARRLMDEIRSDPAYWRERLKQLAVRKTVPKAAG